MKKCIAYKQEKRQSSRMPSLPPAILVPELC